MTHHTISWWPKSDQKSADGLPIIPKLTEPPTAPQRSPDGAIAVCGQCSMRIMPVMGYCCGNARCPVFPKAS